MTNINNNERFNAMNPLEDQIIYTRFEVSRIIRRELGQDSTEEVDIEIVNKIADYIDASGSREMNGADIDYIIKYYKAVVEKKAIAEKEKMKNKVYYKFFEDAEEVADFLSNNDVDVISISHGYQRDFTIFYKN